MALDNDELDDDLDDELDGYIDRVGEEYRQRVRQLYLSEEMYLDWAQQISNKMNKYISMLPTIHNEAKSQNEYHLAIQIIKDFHIDAEKLYHLHGKLLIRMMQKTGYSNDQISIDAECDDKTLIRDDHLEIEYAVRDKLLLRACKNASIDNNIAGKKYTLELFGLMVSTREKYEKINDSVLSMVKTVKQELNSQ